MCPPSSSVSPASAQASATAATLFTALNEAASSRNAPVTKPIRSPSSALAVAASQPATVVSIPSMTGSQTPPESRCCAPVAGLSRRSPSAPSASATARVTAPPSASARRARISSPSTPGLAVTSALTLPSSASTSFSASISPIHGPSAAIALRIASAPVSSSRDWPGVPLSWPSPVSSAISGGIIPAGSLPLRLPPSVTE